MAVLDQAESPFSSYEQTLNQYAVYSSSWSTSTEQIFGPTVAAVLQVPLPFFFSTLKPSSSGELSCHSRAALDPVTEVTSRYVGAGDGVVRVAILEYSDAAVILSVLICYE